MEFKKINWMSHEFYLIFFPFFTLFFFLQGCASSEVARTATRSVDDAYIGLTGYRSEFDIRDTYQNSSQRAKGVVIGGVTGGVVGGAVSGLGAAAGVVTGAILGGSLGAYIDSRTTLVDKLKNRAITIFILGDQVMIVLPSNRIFRGMTPKINYAEYSTLDLVAQLIGCYVNMSVKVAAYTNAGCNRDMNCALSQEQAESVAKYLWKRGVNTRLLYAAGYDGVHLVSSNTSSDSDNYRIEITLEKLPV